MTCVYCLTILLDLDDCHKRLANLSVALKPLVEESQAQSKELDALLESYEKAVSDFLLICIDF